MTIFMAHLKILLNQATLLFQETYKILPTTAVENLTSQLESGFILIMGSKLLAILTIHHLDGKKQ